MQLRFTTAVILLSLIVCVARLTSAAPILTTTTTDLGGGLFAYDLVLHGQDDQHRSFFAQEFTFTGNLQGFSKWYDETDPDASFVYAPWTNNRMGAPVQTPDSYQFSAGTGGGSQYLSLPLARVVVAGDLSISGLIGRGGLTYPISGSFSFNSPFATIESYAPPPPVWSNDPPDLPPAPPTEDPIDATNPPVDVDRPTEPETPAEQETPQSPEPPPTAEVVALPEVIEPAPPVDIPATDPPADPPPTEPDGGDVSIPPSSFPVIIVGPPIQIFPIEEIGDWPWLVGPELRRDLIGVPLLTNPQPTSNGDILLHMAYTTKASSFVSTPEPASWLLAVTAITLVSISARVRRGRTR